MNINKLLLKRVLLLDGAMGTLIQKLNLSEIEFRGKMFINHTHDLKGFYDILCLTQSNIIKNIHIEYLNAGAEIIETNSFNANSFSLSEYGLKEYIYEINYKAAKIARESIEIYHSLSNKQRYVAGCIGPSNKRNSSNKNLIEHNSKEIIIQKIRSAYSQQIKGLIDGGCDLLIIETIYDLITAEGILLECEEQFTNNGKRIPIIISATLTKSGGLASGHSIASFYNVMEQFKPLSIGFNCSYGAEKILEHIEELTKISKYPIHVYPNAGVPNKDGFYTDTPEIMANIFVNNFSQGLVNIIGGCCGTTPEHIKKLHKIKMDLQSRTIEK